MAVHFTRDHLALLEDVFLSQPCKIAGVSVNNWATFCVDKYRGAALHCPQHCMGRSGQLPHGISDLTVPTTISGSETICPKPCTSTQTHLQISLLTSNHDSVTQPSFYIGGYPQSRRRSGGDSHAVLRTVPLEHSNNIPGTLRCHVLSTPKQSVSFIAQKMSQKVSCRRAPGAPRDATTAACFFPPAGFGRASKEKFKVVNKT